MCSVFVICLLCIAPVLTNETSRFKRQEDERWSWGYFEESTPNPINNTILLRGLYSTSSQSETTITQPPPTELTTASSTTASTPESTTKPSYCFPSYVPPTKPDFNAPGRRISEAKCYEYMWEQNNRIKEADEKNICLKYRKRGAGFAIGGRKTLPGEFPHMGAIGWKAVIGTWVFKCGSSLISEKFVLTAAHCAKASTKDTTIEDVTPKIVRLGDKNILDKKGWGGPPQVDVNITRIIVHPLYKSPIKYYDIALMELGKEVSFTRFVQPACLWTSSSTSRLGNQATLTGWGVVESGSLQISPELQAATVDMLESDQCDQLLMSSRNRNWNGFHDDQICAGKLAGGVDSCQGDSGGPLQMKIPIAKEVTDREGSMHYVIGVISFGVGCAHPNLPGIYTRVSSFIDWIEDNVWRNNSTL